MQIHFIDFVTAANLLVLLGIYRKLSIIVYQHKLMWTDFADRKGISANGNMRQVFRKAPGREYANKSI